MLYVDTSALARAWFWDEDDHVRLRELVLGGQQQVFTSELTRVELAAAVAAAVRGGRLRDPRPLRDRMARTFAADGRVTLLELRPMAVIPRAEQLVTAHRLGTLDAVHLAVALVEVVPLSGSHDLTFVTSDVAQAAAAEANGLRVA